MAVRIFSLGALALSFYTVEAEDETDAGMQVEEGMGERACIVYVKNLG